MSASDKKLAEIGRIPQILLILTFAATGWISFSSEWRHPSCPWLVDAMFYGGTALFLYCCHMIYYVARDKCLLTKGPFRFTRHPMYTGMALADTRYWFFPAHHSIWFIIFQVIYIVSLVFAAYCQEKETLLRYGKEAEEYYAKTPRLFLFCPLWYLQKRLAASPKNKFSAGL